MRTVSWVLSLLLVISWSACAYPGEIHQAVYAGDVAHVEALLKGDPSLARTPDQSDRFGSLPLHLAAMTGNVEIGQLLLAAGADIDCGDTDESTPLDVASLNHRIEMVEFLLSKGADVNRRDRNGACAISFAASAGDSAIVYRLLKAGADLNFSNANGYTLLHFAVARNMPGLVDLLIGRGIDVEARTSEGSTPLHIAAGRGNEAMVSALLKAGADPSATDVRGQTPLFATAMQNRAEASRYLLEAGADPNKGDQNGNVPVHVAAWTGSADVLRLLIEHGADVNVVSSTGDIPICSAIHLGHPEILEMLLSAGARSDVRDTRFGATPLQLAALVGYEDAAEILLANGADIEARDRAGATPLQLAVKYGHKSLARMLVAHGAKGSMKGIEAGALASQSALSDGEAVVWYLNHSGYAIKTKSHMLVFDYFNPAPDPGTPGLSNGHIDPRELAGEDVMVFVTHEHQDHFTPAIFEWRNEIPRITYVLGCRPDSAPAYEFFGPRDSRTIDGVRITTIESNDTGVGFWIEVDGLVIFHAGDHANRTRDFSGPYKEEIDFLAAEGKQPDIAFMPVSGCGFGDQEAVKLGVYYALETLKPKVFLPMHSGGAEYRYVDFTEACKNKYPAIQMRAPLARGDRYWYRNGKIS
jgi:ankyrin repeat protein/L-ascorbate metabolism protein UlaG (beta-lactamase superfamily)